MHSGELHHLLAVYGLLAVFAATFAQALCLPVPGSTVVILAAVAAASRHGLPILGVFVVAVAGVTLGGLGGFAIGRWQGEPVLRRLGRLARQPPERVQRLRAGLDRHAVVALLAARWFTGTRNLAGIASGASSMSLARFATLTLAAAALWAAITCVEFYYLGGVLLSAPTWLQAIVLIGGLGLGWLGLRRFGRAAALGDDIPAG